MVEELLESHLNMLGVSPEDFLKACEKAKNQNGISKGVFTFLLAMEDFISIFYFYNYLAFKNMMSKRNNELELECLRYFLVLLLLEI